MNRDIGHQKEPHDCRTINTRWKMCRLAVSITGREKIGLKMPTANNAIKHATFENQKTHISCTDNIGGGQTRKKTASGTCWQAYMPKCRRGKRGQDKGAKQGQTLYSPMIVKVGMA